MKTTVRIAELLDRLNRLLRNDVETGPLKSVHWEVMRFLQQANRFSRTPGAVTARLGITKGTVSQSLKTLERSGFIRKLVDAKDKRVVRLALTASAEQILREDPLIALASCLESTDKENLKVVEEVFDAVLHDMLKQRNHVKFGICHTCKHFQSTKGSIGSYHCGLLNEKLYEEDISQLCIEHA